MMNFDFFDGLSGGISYHFAALRFRRSLWAPFCVRVEDWLKSWRAELPAADPSVDPSVDLIVFGPSAGWTLPTSFVASFQHVLAIEPDPLARALLKRRFGKYTHLETIDDPMLLPWFDPIAPERLNTLLKEHPAAAVLFANVLGQVPLLLNPKQRHHAETSRRHLLHALNGRAWASYHDLLSSNAALKPNPPNEISGLNLEEAADLFFSPTQAGPDLPLHVIDHDTLWISRGRCLKSGVWHLRPRQNHVIGFTHS